MTNKNITWKTIKGTEWCFDDNNNRNSVKRWGSREKAEKALNSLVSCRYCSDCSDCNDCSNCNSCSDCSNCSYCRYCSDCSDCGYCSKNTDESRDKFIIPKISNIHSAVYNAASKEGALNMETWHTCNTTHCRAGWVTTLAGEEGKKLENLFGPSLAASMIYRESSDIKVRLNDFFVSDEESLKSMKEAMEKEQEKVKILIK